MASDDGWVVADGIEQRARQSEESTKHHEQQESKVLT